MSRPTRRQFLHLSAASAAMGLTLPAMARASIPTPEAMEGPFYPTRSMRLSDVDNNLVRIADAVTQAGGEIVTLSGRVLDRNGAPVAGARVEIWQVDSHARYLHPGDRGGQDRDAAFQGFGHDITRSHGRYSFRTIKPVSYPGRTPHIHVKVMTRRTELTTQFYIAGHPENSRDFLFRRMTQAQRKAVEMQFETTDDVPSATVDIHL